MEDLEQVRLDAIKTITNLEQECLNCKGCDLASIENENPNERHVFGSGNIMPGQSICFVGQNPGFDETELKKPFVGESGKIFNKYVLAEFGLTRSDIWITNAVLCYTKNNVKPTKEHIAACKKHLIKQLEFIKPKLIVVLGAVPMYSVLGIEEGISKYAGKIIDSDIGYKVGVLLHPAFYARSHKFNELEYYVKELKKKFNEFV